MFEIELELLDKQIGDLEVARLAAEDKGDRSALRSSDQKLEQVWNEVRRLSALEGRLDIADPEERVRILGLPN